MGKAAWKVADMIRADSSRHYVAVYALIDHHRGGRDPLYK